MYNINSVIDSVVSHLNIALVIMSGPRLDRHDVHQSHIPDTGPR